MRDYVSFFINNSGREMVGVSECRDIDWWVEYFASRMAKVIFIILFGICLLLVKSFWVIGKSSNAFPIEKVSINGKMLITQEKDVVTVLEKMPESSFFQLDLTLLSEELTELPWVQSVEIKRQWPDKLLINVHEQEVGYRWGDKELLDYEGNRFARTNQVEFEKLPKIEGVNGYEQKVISAYQQLVGALGEDVHRLDIDKFILNDYLSWELHLRSGLVVKFGRDDFPQRLIRFAHAYRMNKLPEAEQITTVDFRYHKGFAVKWKPEFITQPQMDGNNMVNASLKDI